LADFGMARAHTQSMSVRKTASGPFGTLNWMAPEMIAETAVSQAIDVYAFGIIVWEMCSGMIPWAGLAEQTIMFKVAMKGERPRVERGTWPGWACDLMEACWHQDPKKRPTMADVLVRLRTPATLVPKAIAAAAAPASVADVKPPPVPRSARPSSAVSRSDPAGPASAATIARPAFVSGQTKQLFRKGYSFATGTGGVAKDEREAVKWYRLAADQRYAIAQYNLGVCYQNGTGVAKDLTEAAKWLRLAADQGHTGAIDALRQLGV
jgi:serine/threonine protein kinase